MSQWVFTEAIHVAIVTANHWKSNNNGQES